MIPRSDGFIALPWQKALGKYRGDEDNLVNKESNGFDRQSQTMGQGG